MNSALPDHAEIMFCSLLPFFQVPMLFFLVCSACLATRLSSCAGFRSFSSISISQFVPLQGQTSTANIATLNRISNEQLQHDAF